MLTWLASLFQRKYVWRLYRYFPDRDEKAYITITSNADGRSVQECSALVDRFVKDGWVVKAAPAFGVCD
jgi:hypothetical protein